MKRSFFGITASLALAGATQAAIILVDDFESYTAFSDMHNQGGWDVTRPFSPFGPVVIADIYTWDGSFGSATVGGYEQTLNNPPTYTPNLGVSALSHTLSVPVHDSSNGHNTYISFETAYTESLGLDPRNPFSFVVQVNGTDSLLTIDLTPAGAGQYDVNWSSDFAAGGYIGTLSANTSTQFGLLMGLGDTGIDFVLSNAGDVEATGTFSGLTATDLVTSFSASWDSTGGGGGNSITIDNVSIIPEPSSSLLGLLGATLAFTRRRRA